MDYNSLIIYFSALLLGCITIFTAYFLHKTYKLPYLSDYVYFLLLANVWGFFIWIAPDLLKIFESDGQGPFISYKMISVVKWFGFPFHLLQLYFLVRMLWGMMDLPVRRLFKNIYILFISSTTTA